MRRAARYVSLRSPPANALCQSLSTVLAAVLRSNPHDKRKECANIYFDRHYVLLFVRERSVDNQLFESKYMSEMELFIFYDHIDYTVYLIINYHLRFSIISRILLSHKYGRNISVLPITVLSRARVSGAVCIKINYLVR